MNHPVAAIPMTSTTRMPITVAAELRDRAVDQALRLGLGLAVLGDEQPAQGVEQEAGAAEDREDDEQDAEDQRVDAGLLAEAAGDAERPCGRCGCGAGRTAAGSRGAPARRWEVVTCLWT